MEPTEREKEMKELIEREKKCPCLTWYFEELQLNIIKEDIRRGDEERERKLMPGTGIYPDQDIPKQTWEYLMNLYQYEKESKPNFSQSRKGLEIEAEIIEINASIASEIQYREDWIQAHDPDPNKPPVTIALIPIWFRPDEADHIKERIKKCPCITWYRQMEKKGKKERCRDRTKMP